MPLLARYSRVRDTDVMFLATSSVFFNEIIKLTITYQLKILTTALFFVMILRKPLSAVQWGSLVVLMVGVSLVQLQDQITGSSPPAAQVARPTPPPGPDDLPKQNRVLGFVAVLTMCMSSGFAGVYFEKVLKGSTLSIWMQNVRLSLLGGIIQGYDWLVWTITFCNSAGGLTIAVVMKYADNILKAYAQSLAIIFACIGSGVMFNFVPTMPFVGGTCLVIFSVFLYAQFPYKVKETVKEEKAMLKTVVDGDVAEGGDEDLLEDSVG